MSLNWRSYPEPMALQADECHFIRIGTLNL